LRIFFLPSSLENRDSESIYSTPPQTIITTAKAAQIAKPSSKAYDKNSANEVFSDISLPIPPKASFCSGVYFI
jgi:hypothetical protein